MMFLFPIMLIAAGSIAVPVIIHLIQKQKFPKRWVATVRFLPKDQRVNRFAPRLIDLLQLLLRIVVLLAIAALMARPFIGSGTSAPRNFVLVLDSSMSMSGAGADAGSIAFSDAKEWAKQMIDGLGRHDRAGLIIADTTIVKSIPLTRDHEKIAAAITESSPGDRDSSGIVPAIAGACDMLDGKRERANIIFVLSDLRANLIQQGQDEPSGRIRAALGDERLYLRLVRFGKDEARNAEVTDCRVTPQVATVGSSIKLSPRVRNYSDKEMKVTVDLRLRGLPSGSARPVTVSANSECVVDIVTRFKTRGSSYATAALGSDDLNADNEFHVPLRPSARSEVLIIAGTSSAKPSDDDDVNEVDVPTILAYALNPAFSLAGDAGTNLRPKVVRADSIGTIPLDRYRLFILSGVSSLPDRTLQDIRDLLAGSREKRGLIIVPDDAMNALQFNEIFTAVGGSENLPLTAAKLGPLVACDPPLDWASSASGSPIMAAFRGPTGLARDIRMFQRFDIEPVEGAEVFLRGTDGSALGVMMDYGRGRIVTLGFSFARRYTNLVGTPAMLTFAWQLADHLTGRDSLPEREATRAGRQMAIDLSEFRGIHGNMRLLRVGDDSEEPQLFALEKEDESVIPRFEKKGVYEFGHEKRYRDRSRYIAVNGPGGGEGDTKPLTEERMLSVLGEPGHSVFLPADANKDIPSGTELWPWFLALLAVAYGAEAVAGHFLSLRKQEEART
jgi:hypothetical protein